MNYAVKRHVCIKAATPFRNLNIVVKIVVDCSSEDDEQSYTSSPCYTFDTVLVLRFVNGEQIIMKVKP